MNREEYERLKVKSGSYLTRDQYEKAKKGQGTISNGKVNLTIKGESGDSKDFGVISSNAYHAISNGLLDYYNPINDEEKKVIERYKNEVLYAQPVKLKLSDGNETTVKYGTVKKIEDYIANNEDKFGNAEYNAYMTDTKDDFIEGFVKDAEPFLSGLNLSDDEYRVAKDYMKSLASQHQNKMGTLTKTTYIPQVITNSAVDSLADGGLFILGTVTNALEGVTSLLGTKPNKVSEFFGNATDKILSHKTIGDKNLEYLNSYSKPEWVTTYADPLLQSAGRILPDIAIGYATGGASALASGAKGLQATQKSANIILNGSKLSRAVNTTKLAAKRFFNPASTMFGLSAAGSSTQEAYATSKDANKALVYGAGSGLLEMATESLFAGIAGTNTFESVIKWGSKNKTLNKIFTNSIVSKGLDTLGEGLEESISTFLDPYLRRATFDPNAKSATGKEYGMSALQGILLSGVMGVATYPVQKANIISTAKSVNNAFEALAKVMPNETIPEPLNVKFATAKQVKQRQEELKSLAGKYEQQISDFYDNVENSVGLMRNELTTFKSGIITEESIAKETDATKKASLQALRTAQLDYIADTEQTINDLNAFLTSGADESTVNRLFGGQVEDNFKPTYFDKISGDLVSVQQNQDGTIAVKNAFGSVLTKSADIFNSRYTKIEDVMKAPDTKMRNTLASGNLTSKAIEKIVNNKGLAEAFERVTGTKLVGTKAERRAIVRNVAESLKGKATIVNAGDTFIESGSNKIIKVLERGDTHAMVEITTPDGKKETKMLRVEAIDNMAIDDKYTKVETTTEAKNTPVTDESVSDDKVVTNNESGLTDAEISIVVDAMNETLKPGALDAIYDSMPSHLEKSLDLFADRLVGLYNKVGNLGKIADYFTDGGAKVVETIVGIKNTENEVNVEVESKLFNDIVDEVATNTSTEGKKGKYFYVARHTPEIIVKNANIDDLPMIISFETLYLAVRDSGELKGHYHNLGTDKTKMLYAVLSNPTYILKNNTNGRINIISDIAIGKNNKSVVSIELDVYKNVEGNNVAKHKGNYNLVITLFSAKDNYSENLKNNKDITVLYEKKEDTLGSDLTAENVPLGNTTEISSKESISQDVENVNISSEVLKNEPESATIEEKTATENGNAKRETNDVPVSNENHTVAYTNDNQKIDLKFKVVSVDDLIVSNYLDGKVNPDYPQELQPRDRSRVSSRSQILQMANNLNPARLAESTSVSEGSPIVGADNVVESGNGRTLAINLAYANGTADEYRNHIIRNADKYGIDISNLPERPILVRERLTEVNRVDFTRKANESSIGSLSATEQAKVDAEKLTGDVLNLLVANDNGTINTSDNRDFISAVINRVFKSEDLNNVVNADGMLSARGLERIKNAIFYKAYGDASLSARLSESLDNDMKNATNVLLNIAPKVVYVKNGIASGNFYDFDFSEDIASAVRLFEKCRNENNTVNEYASQTTMFEKESQIVMAMAYVFETKNRGAKQATDFYSKVLDTVIGLGDKKQLSLVDVSEMYQTKGDIFNEAHKRYNEGVGTDRQITIPENIYRPESITGRDDDRRGIYEVSGSNSTISKEIGNTIGVQQDNRPGEEAGVVADDAQLRQTNESIERQSEVENDDVTKNVTTESEGNDNELRSDTLSENSRWGNNGGTRKQIERISYFKRKNQGRNAEERQSFARELIKRGQAEEVTKKIGKYAYKYTFVKPEHYNDDMLAMVEQAKEKGVELGFFIGNAKVSFDSKDKFLINGIKISNSQILVQYDENISPQKLFKHELIHAKWKTRTIQAIKNTILNNLTEADKNTILSQERMQRYQKIYKDKNGKPLMDIVWEEFVCDVMSGMNDYTAKYIDTTYDYWYGNESVDSYNPADYTTSKDAGGKNAERYSLNWRTDLNKTQYKEVEKWIHQVGSPEATRITDTANWYKGRINGEDLFVIYSTQDTTPTIMYEVKGANAKLEQRILLDLLEVIENGESINRKPDYVSWVSKGSWVQKVNNIQNNLGNLGSGQNNQNVGVLQRQPQRNGSRAFWNVLENLFKIQEQDGNVRFSLKDSEGKSLTKEQLEDILREKRNEIAQDVVDSRRYNFAEDSEGNVVDLSTDNELMSRIKGLKGSSKYKTIRDYILETIDDIIIFSDGIEAKVDKSDAGHIASKAGHKKTAYLSKINEIIANAKLFSVNDNVVHNKFDKFRYYQVNIRLDGQLYPIYLNVGHAKNGDGYHLYDITKNVGEAEKQFPVFERVNDLRSKNDSPTSESVSQDVPDVKPQNVKDILPDKENEYLNTRKVNEDGRAEENKAKTSFKDEINSLPAEDKEIVLAVRSRAMYATSIATMSEDRLSKAYSDYSYSNPSTTKGYLAYIEPYDFLSLTTTSTEEFLKQNPQRLNEGVSVWGNENNIQNSGALYLRIDENGNVVGHEGRHRMAGLLREGVDRVAVIIQTDRVDNAKPISIKKLSGQDFGDTKSYSSVYVHNMLPISKEYENINKHIFGDITEGNRFAEPNMRYSLADSEGNTLTEEQQEYFKDSKVRDKDGNLLVVYHGTRKNDFTVFSRNHNYYTDNRVTAESYAPSGAMYEGYLNITKPYIIDAGGAKWSAIPVSAEVKKMLDTAGSSTFKERGKWCTSVADIVAAISDLVEEGDADYDGVIVRNVEDTGSYYNGSAENVGTDYITFSSEQFKNVDNTTPTSNPDIRYSFADNSYAPTFYSHMGKTIDEMKQDKIGANSVVSYLKGRGVKDEEIRWSGIEEFLDGKKSVTKAELQEFVASSQLQIEMETRSNDYTIEYTEDESKSLNELVEVINDIWQDIDTLWLDKYGKEIPFDIRFADNAVSAMYREINKLQRSGDDDSGFFNDILRSLNRIGTLERNQQFIIERAKERMLGDDADVGTKWDDHKLNGGSNYREMVFKMPDSTYSNSAMRTHWGDDAEGILAHARVQDFDVDGKKMLFIEEIQSDWHNQGHKSGYRNKGQKTEREIRLADDKAYDDFMNSHIIQLISQKLRDVGYENAPTIIANLWEGNTASTYAFLERLGIALTNDEKAYIEEEVYQSEERHKDLSNAARDNTAPDAPFRNNYHEYVLKSLIRMAAEEGYDSIGWTPSEIQSERWSDDYAEGYRIEYDQDIPKFLNKYGKKWGAKVGVTTLENSEETKVWSMPITDEMKDSVLYEGQPRYSLTEEDNAYMDAIKKGDMETADKIIEEVAKKSGYTIKAYHGTPNNDFTVFDKDRVGKGTDQFGAGFYFASNKDAAKAYGQRVINSRLSVNNPIKLNGSSDEGSNLIDGGYDYLLTEEQAYEVIKRLPNIYDSEESILGDYYDSYWESGAEEWMIEDLATNEFNRNIGGLDSDLFRNYPNELHEAIRDVVGYDGVEVSFDNGDKFYVAWFNNQMKSAEPITYDKDGNVIPPSQRFNPESDDIRWSLATDGIPDLEDLWAEDIEPEPNVRSSSRDIKSDTPQSNDRWNTERVEVEKIKPKKAKEKVISIANKVIDVVNKFPGLNISNIKDEGADIGEIVKMIKDSFDIPISTGKVTDRRASGIYKVKEEAIRIKVTNNIPTIFHELGHHLDKMYKLSKLDSVKKLREALPQAFLDQYPANERNGEAVAEFVRTYLKNTNEAKSLCNDFYIDFVKMLSKDDINAVDLIANVSNEYLSSTFSERVQSAIVSGDTKGKTSLKEKAKEMYADWVDSNVPIKDVVDYVESASGTSLSGSKNAYTLATNSLNARAIANFNTVHGFRDLNGNIVEGAKSYIECLANVNKKDLNTLDEYLVLKHSLEWIAPQVEGVKNKRVFGDDTLEDVNAIKKRIAEIESEHPEMKQAAEDLYEYQRNILKHIVVPAGGMTMKTFNSLNEKYPCYVPFYRAIGKNSAKTKGSLANQKSPLKRAKGSGEQIISPLESIINNTDKMVKFALRNQTMQVIANYADTVDGFGKFMEQVPPDMLPHTTDISQLRDKFEDALQQVVSSGEDFFEVSNLFEEVFGDSVTGFTPVANANKKIVTVLKNGEFKYYQVHDDALFSTIAEFSPKNLEGIFAISHKIMQPMKLLITQNNPVFAGTNAIRDIATAYKHSPINNPVEFAKKYASALKEVVTKGENYKQWQAMGGGHNSELSANIDDVKTALRLTAEKDMGKARRLLYSIVMHPIATVASFNDYVESVPRLMEFTRTLESGGDLQEAIFNADDITTNFKKGGKGALAKNVNSLIMFNNAALQGLDKAGRTLTNKDKSARTKSLIKWAVSALLMAAIQSLWNMSNDDEGYETLSSYKKNNFYNFSIGDGKFISLPKARELALLDSFTERTIELAFGNDEAFYGFGGYLVDQLLPPMLPTSLNPVDAAHDVLGSTVLGGMIDVGFNENFMGTPIESAYDKYQPSNERYTENTSKLAYGLGQTKLARSMDMSPKRIDHLISSYTGIIGQINKALAPMSEERRDVTIGLRNKFVSDSAYSTDLLNKMYDNKDKAELNWMYNNNIDNAIEYEQNALITSYISGMNKAIKELPGDEQRDARKYLLKTLNSWNYETTSQQSKMQKNLKGESVSADYIFSEIPSSKLEWTHNKQKYVYQMTPQEYSNYVSDYLNAIENARNKFGGDSLESYAKAKEATKEYMSKYKNNLKKKYLNKATKVAK